MLAYRCDFCGQFFGSPTTIHMRELIDNKFFSSMLVKSGDREGVDVCNGCNYVITSALRERLEEKEKEREDEYNGSFKQL